MEREDVALPESLDGMPGGDSSSDGAGSLETVTAERDQLLADKADLHDRLLRRQAEFDNFRRRADRERVEFAQYAASEAVTALLPILDDFERALKQESTDKEFLRGTEL